MNQSSTLILEKMVDYFGSWEEKEIKKDMRLKKKEVKQVRSTRVKHIEYDKNEATMQRREEMLIFKKELRSLDKIQLSDMKISHDTYTRERQAQIIHVKNVLNEEMGSKSYLRA